MKNYDGLEDKLYRSRDYLLEGERSGATIEKHGRSVRAFPSRLLDDGEILKEMMIGYRQAIIEEYKTTNTNSTLVSMSRFLNFIQKEDCQIKLFKIQGSLFRKRDEELAREEYNRLALAAKTKSSSRSFLMIQTICSADIRVSKHRFITREALEKGNVTTYNKGRERAALLSEKLKKGLIQCCRQSEIHSGPILITKNGTPVSRCNVWAEMKALCKAVRVSPEKASPHNLRHLLAITYYQVQKNIVYLADILECSNIEYTRIYTLIDEEEYVRVLSRVCLLI